MKRKHWLSLLAALLVLALTATVASATAYHTITVDGDTSEWGPDDVMETDNGGDLYLTWDENNLYIGLGNVNVDDDGVFFVYLDTTTGGSTTSATWNGTHTLPFAADYGIAVDADNSINWLSWNSGTSSWDWNAWPGSKYVGQNSNPTTELSVPWTSMGSPTANLYVMAFFQNQNNNGVTASWPTPNPANNSGSETFTHFYHFPSLVDGISPDASVLADHVVINEFNAKGAEHIELYNPTASAVDLTGWYLSDGEGTDNLSGSLAAGGYLDVATILGLSNNGDEIMLYDASDTLVDQVAYGFNGAAPIEFYESPGNYSIQRAPNGTDTDDDARDFNMSKIGGGTTFGAANNAAVALLGSSIVINEVNAFQDADDDVNFDYYELYNPLTHTVVMTGWYATDGGDSLQVFTDTIPAGGWTVYSGTLAIGYNDAIYLWNNQGIRLDQITSDAPGSENGSIQRICDGDGPNDGYNWSTSGGDSTLFELPTTYGTTNTPGPIGVSKTGPATASAGDVITYVVTIQPVNPTPALSYTLTDTLPVGVDFISSDPVGTYDPMSHTVSWSGALDCGFPLSVLTITARITTSLSPGAVLTNQVTIDATGDFTPTSDTAVLTTTVVGVDVSVSKTGPSGPVWPGDTITYTVSFDLIGTDPALDVILTDTWPVSFTYTAHMISPTMACTPSLTHLVCAAPTLTRSGQLIITGTVAASPTVYVLTNTVEITASNDGSTSNNIARYVHLLVMPIHEIQHVPDPANDDASPYTGQYVWTDGVVTAASSDFGGTRYFIEDWAGGPWSGLYVYHNGDRPPVQEGDWVAVYGQVNEYHGLTELDLRNSVGGQQYILSSGNPLPAPAVIATGDYVNAGTAEQWESVLIEFQGATVTDANLGYGEWAFDDGSGATRADDLSSSLTYTPANGDYYGYIRGLGYYSYSNYKLEPRYDADIDLDYPVTFRYHDAEDVVHSGEAVYLSGDFNGWNTTATSMTANADYSLFTVTVTLTDTGTYEYKYIVYTDTVPSGPAQRDWLNTYNRSLTVTRPFRQQDDYRNVVIGRARLQRPSTLTVNLGETSDSVSGRLFVNNVTNPAGEGRGLQAQVGYGNDVDPANWSWSPMTYNADDGDNDEFMGTLTPTARGVYSYAVRFDGNWGMGNPNAGWVYADLDGYAPFGDPFELGQTGVMTVTAPNLTLAKAVTPTTDIELADSVTYTLVLSNSGDGAATGVVLTDALPAGVSFGGWVQQGGAVQAGNVITWTGDMAAGNAVTIILTATVSSDLTYAGQTITNTVSFTSTNAGSGSDDAAFAVAPTFRIYLPLVVKNQ